MSEPLFTRCQVTPGSIQWAACHAADQARIAELEKLLRAALQKIAELEVRP